MESRAVAFDLFGTILKRENRNYAYKDLFHRIGAKPHEGALIAMSSNLGFRELAEFLRPDHDCNIDDLEADLLADLADVQLYDDALEVLTYLRTEGIPVAAISNLAQPFAARSRELLDSVIDRMVLSCEVGLLNPPGPECIPYLVDL